MFRIQKRHCLMIIDCCSHPNPLAVKLTNLTINFLSKYTTSHTQPCDAGIICDLKFIIARIMISYSSSIACLLFCHYWESMKRLQRISAISAKYSGSREIRSSEVLLYMQIGFSHSDVFCFNQTRKDHVARKIAEKWLKIH